MRLLNRATRTLIVAATAAVSLSHCPGSNPGFHSATNPGFSTSSCAGLARRPSAQNAPASQQPANPMNGTYISSDPLANVKYDNRWDVSVGLAYGHIHAGPTLA